MPARSAQTGLNSSRDAVFQPPDLGGRRATSGDSASVLWSWGGGGLGGLGAAPGGGGGAPGLGGLGAPGIGGLGAPGAPLGRPLRQPPSSRRTRATTRAGSSAGAGSASPFRPACFADISGVAGSPYGCRAAGGHAFLRGSLGMTAALRGDGGQRSRQARFCRCRNLAGGRPCPGHGSALADAGQLFIRRLHQLALRHEIGPMCLMRRRSKPHRCRPAVASAPLLAALEHPAGWCDFASQTANDAPCSSPPRRA